MAARGSRWLPTAPYDYKHTLLLFSSSMTPTDFHLLPPRELTRSLLPAPYSLASIGALELLLPGGWTAAAGRLVVLIGFRNFTSRIEISNDNI